MIPIWPAALRQTPARDSFAGGPLSGRVSFKPERGPPVERRAVTAETIRKAAVFPQMTGAALAAFRSFFADDLQGGVLPFAWRDPVDGLPWRWKIIGEEREYQETSSGANLHDLSLQLMRLPGRPWWQPYATNVGDLVLPAMVADFRAGLYGAEGVAGPLGDLLTYTGGTNGAYLNASGAWVAAAGAPRITWDTTGARHGLLVEPARTNLLLNSGTLATQSVTVTAAAHVLSFTGTGTVTLSGASTAGPLVGTGTGEGNRVELAFTPSAGSLTLTVSGTVTNAQLEAGVGRSSYIATAGAAVTRAADSPAFASAPWLTAGRGTLIGVARRRLQLTSAAIAYLSGGSTSNRVQVAYRDVGGVNGFIAAGGVTQAQINDAGTYDNVTVAVGLTYGTDVARVSVNGVPGTPDMAVTVPALNQGRAGQISTSNSVLNGVVEMMIYYPETLAVDALHDLTLRLSA